MNPSEFTSFEKEKPEPHKWLIVTNNLSAEDSHREMSHVWMTTFWTIGSRDDEGIVTYDDYDRKISGLTHWKYA